MAPHPGSTLLSPLRRAVKAAGTSFLVLGCAGFLPGVTVDLERIHLTGPGSPTALLGVLPVTVAGNLVHLAFAVGALLSLSSEGRARAYLLWGGALYGVLCARSIVMGTGASATSPSAGAGLWVPLAAGVAMMGVGWLAESEMAPNAG